jgi:hypothetical protein
VQRNEPLTVASREEFEQACEISLQTGNIEEGLPTLDDLTVVGSEDSRIEIAVALFRLRFAAQWDTAAVQQDEMKEAIGYYEELDEFFDRMSVPFKPEVIFAGEGRNYHEPELDRMDFNGNRARALQALERCADLARHAGYQPAGALLCTTHPFEFVRLNLNKDRTVLLVELVSQLGGVARELYTEFQSGTVLITSSSQRRYSLPHRGVLARSVDDPAIDRLTREHEAGLRHLGAQAGPLKTFGATLPEIAEAIERIFFRIEGPGIVPAAKA